MIIFSYSYMCTGLFLLCQIRGFMCNYKFFNIKDQYQRSWRSKTILILYILTLKNVLTKLNVFVCCSFCELQKYLRGKINCLQTCIWEQSKYNKGRSMIQSQTLSNKTESRNRHSKGPSH